MARNLWKGAISFSLVHIPVALRTATRAEALDLDMLDKRDFSPIGFQRVNKTTGEQVEFDQIIKGYEYKPGEYVVLTDEDFRRANVAATQTIEIQSFVDSDAIPPYFFDTPYYVAAQPRGEKVYVLLRDALARAGKTALALAVIRTRQYLCALFPVDDMLVLNTLRYADEILPWDAVGPAAAAKAAVSSKEMSLALRLIEDMSEEWRPEQFRDTYREDILKRVEEKVESGQTHELTASERPRKAVATTDLADLSALLQRSLEGSGEQRPALRSRRARRTSRGPAGDRAGRRA